MAIIVEKVFDKTVLESLGLPNRIAAAGTGIVDRTFVGAEAWVTELLQTYRKEQKIPWEKSEHDGWTETDDTFVLTIEFLDKTAAEEYANLRRSAAHPYLISITVKEI